MHSCDTSKTFFFFLSSPEFTSRVDCRPTDYGVYGKKHGIHRDFPNGRREWVSMQNGDFVGNFSCFHPLYSYLKKFLNDFLKVKN